MSIEHVVVQGEHVSRIARKYGWLHYDTIWNDGANADLKQLRGTPHILAPGDVVVVPDHQDRTESRATEATHRFRVPALRLTLRLQLLSMEHEPVAGTDVQFRLEGRAEDKTTDGAGKVEEQIAPATEIAKLVVGATQYSIKVGHLDPIDLESGVVARLNNLGYFVPEPAERDADSLNSALEEFEKDHGITPLTGRCEGATRDKLLEVHGS